MILLCSLDAKTNGIFKMTSIFMANFCLNSMGMVVMDLTFISNGQIILLIDSKYQCGSTL